MTYYLVLFFTFFKYLAYLTSFFINIKIFSFKFLLLSGIIICIYITVTYPKPFGPRFYKLSELRSYRNKFYENIILSYKLKTLKEYLLNILLIILYILIFVIGFFILKIVNTSGQINVPKIYQNLIDIYLKFSWLDRIYYFLLSFFLFILLLLLLVKIKKLFSKSFHRVHFYLFQYEFYENIFIFIYENSITSLGNKVNNIYLNIISYLLLGKIPEYKNGKFINLSEIEENLYLKNRIFSKLHMLGNMVIAFFIKKFHYLLIIVAMIYDFLFNNMILTKVFYVYPFAHIFQFWLSINNFYERRSLMLDSSFMELLYKPESYSQSDIVQIPGYVLNNFVAPWLVALENRQKIAIKIRKLKRIIKVRKVVKKLIKSFRFRRH